MVRLERWEEMRRLWHERVPMAEISRRLELDRKTVRRCLRDTGWAAYHRPLRTDTVLAPHLDYLRERAPRWAIPRRSCPRSFGNSAATGAAMKRPAADAASPEEFAAVMHHRRLFGRQTGKRLAVAQGVDDFTAYAGPARGRGVRVPDVLAVQLPRGDQHGELLDFLGQRGRRLDVQFSLAACRSGPSSRSRGWHTASRSPPRSNRAGRSGPLRCARPPWGWSRRRPASG